jgi:NADH dehydrogenase subunit L (EC 1.6.5.3)
MTVTGVGTIIHFYSIGYMKGDAGFARYFAYLNLFIFFMLNLVLANNLILMFLGWEGVGLCSYLLIGYYYDTDYAPAAGLKAFIVNRIGDMGFLIGIFLVIANFGTVHFGKLSSAVSTGPVSITLMTGITLMFLSVRQENQHRYLYTYGSPTLWQVLHRFQH